MIAIPGDLPVNPSTTSQAAVKLEVKTLDQAEAGGWNTMVAAHPMGSVFQHTAYGRMLLATFRHIEPYYLSLVDGQGAITGGLGLFRVRSFCTPSS